MIKVAIVKIKIDLQSIVIGYTEELTRHIKITISVKRSFWGFYFLWDIYNSSAVKDFVKI